MLTLLCIVLDSLVTIFREEGPAALYKGFVPKVLRLAPGGGVLLLVVEFTLNVFRQGAPCPAFAPTLFVPELELTLAFCLSCSTWAAVHLSTGRRLGSRESGT